LIDSSKVKEPSLKEEERLYSITLLETRMRFN